MRILLFLGLILLFTGCRKLTDAINHNTSKTKCSIRTVTDFITGHNTTMERVATVNYNADGNPISVTYNRRETGYGWATLKYDKYQRLIELNEENNALRRYVYNASDAQPVRDTMFAYNIASTFVEYFTYDDKNRIVNVKVKFISNDYGETFEDYEENYSYNAQGNLTGSSNYDNKVSVYSTHRVWMFIFRNYSVNNLATAVSYNNRNLPLDFTGSTGPTMRFFEGAFNGAKITYNCK